MHVDVPYDEFASVVLATARELRHRYTGFLTRDLATDRVTSFTRTRLPRNKYGPPLGIPECEAGIHYLAKKLGTTAAREVLSSGVTRIILGLYQGQHESGVRAESEPDYSVDDVALRLGPKFDVLPVEVFSVRLGPSGEVSYYSEVSAAVLGPKSQKMLVYNLGDAMKQERFSDEDDIGVGGWSSMIETRWCKEPDLPEPI